jgi:hypothetical protein
MKMDSLKSMGRRQFAFGAVKVWGAILLASVTGTASLTLIGCGITIQDIENWIPTGKSAIANLLNLLGAAGVIPLGVGTMAAALLTSVTNALDDVLADIQQWQSSGNAALLSKIQVLLQSVSTQLSDFLSPLPIPSAISTLISGLLGLILSTIAGFIATVAQKVGSTPAGATASARRTIAMRSTGHTIAVEPLKIGRDEFVKRFNRQIDAAGKSEFAIK